MAIIQVGAQTETELKEKKLRVEDALNATKVSCVQDRLSYLPGQARARGENRQVFPVHLVKVRHCWAPNCLLLAHEMRQASSRAGCFIRDK